MPLCHLCCVKLFMIEDLYKCKQLFKELDVWESWSQKFLEIPFKIPPPKFSCQILYSLLSKLSQAWMPFPPKICEISLKFWVPERKMIDHRYKFFLAKFLCSYPPTLPQYELLSPIDVSPWLKPHLTLLWWASRVKKCSKREHCKWYERLKFGCILILWSWLIHNYIAFKFWSCILLARMYYYMVF